MNRTDTYELTIIVPIYNEAENIERLSSTLADYLKQASVTACVLFVDDGSTDNSRPLVTDACRRHAHLYYIGFERNCGLSAALKAGIDTARSPYVGYIDADLQTSPYDFELLLPHRHAYALVTGIRTGRRDSLGKRLSSRIANGFRRMMTGDDALDTGCPLKIMQTDVARRIPFFNGMHRFLPALVMLQQKTFKQLPVRHFERTAGASKFHLSNRLIGPLTDCFAYRWMKRRYINYRIEAGNASDC